MEQFEQAFREALQLALGENGRLIVFVDDLDRCLPEQAIEVLEAIKLFLEVEGTVFVLGMDKEVVELGIQARYGAMFHTGGMARAELPISGDAYLQKIVQIPFHLPPLVSDDLECFITPWISNCRWKNGWANYAQGLRPGPLAQSPPGEAGAEHLPLAAAPLPKPGKATAASTPTAWPGPCCAKTVVIQTQYPDLYRHWRQYPRLIQRLEKEYGENPVEEGELERGVFSRKGGDEEKTRQIPDTDILTPYLNDRRKYVLLARMLSFPAAAEKETGRTRARFQGLEREQMAVYVRLAGAVEAEPPIEMVAREHLERDPQRRPGQNRRCPGALRRAGT